MDSLSTSSAATATNKIPNNTRSALDSRLQALVDDNKLSPASSRVNSPSPRSSEESARASTSSHGLSSSPNSPPDPMWRSQPLNHVKKKSSSSSSFSGVSRTKRPTMVSNMAPPRVHPPVAPLASTDSLPSTSAQSFPILRWFGRPARQPKSPAQSPSPPVATNSDDGLSASSSSSSCPSPTSPPSALREAFEYDIRRCSSPSSPDELQIPPPVCLPSTLAGAHGQGPGRVSVRRSPPFLDNLVRCTLPTSSVTLARPQPVFKQPTDQFHPNNQTASSLNSQSQYSRAFGRKLSRPIHQTPASRTSIDTLRSLRDRGMTVDATAAAANSHSRSFSTNWWFGNGNKANVDSLLDESDQADTIEGEAAKIRKRCTYICLL